jgi:membrane protein YdbS with pleckstrin-like domain
VDSSRAPDPGAATEGDPISATAGPRAGSGDAPLSPAPAAFRDAGEPAAVALAGDLPIGRRQLPSRVVRYWRWRAFFGSVPLVVMLIGLAIVVPWGPWWFRWGIVGVVAVLVAGCMTVLPRIRYRVFWYATSPTEIDIQHGIVFIKRSVVPMHRVQSLRIERGPVADHYQVTNLKIRTAGGSVSLRGLDRGEADELCHRISRLTELTDDV